MANPLQQAMQRQLMDDAFANKLKPLKPALSHVGLYMGLVVYTAVGALVKILFLQLIKIEAEMSNPFGDKGF